MTRANAPKAINLPAVSKTTLKSLIEADERRKTTRDCDATLSTVESSLQQSQDELDFDLALADSFEHDLSFQQIPTGGVITLPREHYESCPSASYVPLPDARIQPKRSTSVSTPCEKPVHDLHVECLKPPPFPSESYITPTSAHEHLRPLATPPTPKHSCRRLDHFDWPDRLYMPLI